MENSKIEWTDHTFSPWRGCTKIAEGCRFCYADAMSARNPGTLGVWGPNGKRVVAAESYWKLPLKWDRQAAKDGVRRKVFCGSLMDIFEDWTGPMHDVSGNVRRFCSATRGEENVRPETMQDVRNRVFETIDRTPHLLYLCLTKRPENALRMIPLSPAGRENLDNGNPTIGPNAAFHLLWRPNVWSGYSIAERKDLEKLHHLRAIPAAVRFLSIEPLIEDLGTLDLTGIGWVIVGGESGPNARPMHPDWVRSIRDQCLAAGVLFFMKQMGGKRKPFDPIPDDLMIREFPNA